MKPHVEPETRALIAFSLMKYKQFLDSLPLELRTQIKPQCLLVEMVIRDVVNANDL